MSCTHSVGGLPSHRTRLKCMCVCVRLLDLPSPSKHLKQETHESHGAKPATKAWRQQKKKQQNGKEKCVLTEWKIENKESDYTSPLCPCSPVTDEVRDVTHTQKKLPYLSFVIHHPESISRHPQHGLDCLFPTLETQKTVVVKQKSHSKQATSM